MNPGYLVTALLAASLILPGLSAADNNSHLEQVEILSTSPLQDRKSLRMSRNWFRNVTSWPCNACRKISASFKSSLPSKMANNSGLSSSAETSGRLTHSSAITYMSFGVSAAAPCRHVGTWNSASSL